MLETKVIANKQYITSISIIGLLFFIFGFITWLNSTLIPYLKISCELKSNMQANLVAFAFYISYFIMAIPSSWVLKKVGFKGGMSLGLIVIAIGALVFIPSALNRSFGLFLCGLFLQGTGLTILQIASNPYAAIIGPIESAAKRISIMGICNKVAGIISPIIMGFVVLQGIDDVSEKVSKMDSLQKAAELDILASKVILPYIIMAIVLFILAIAIKYSPLPEINEETNSANKYEKRKSIFSFPYLWLGVLAIFFYVGAEVVSIDTQILYGKLIGFKLSEAKFFSSITLSVMIVGYIIGIIAIPKYISQANALKYFAIMGVIFSILALFTHGFTSILAIALLGLANSIMWPAIWPLAIEGLGRFTKLASSLLIMGILGGALFPLLWGYLADLKSVGGQNAYLILVPIYLYLIYYASIGHKIGKTK